MSHDKDEKARKLAEALRANLRRRKEQSRELASPPEPSDEDVSKKGD